MKVSALERFPFCVKAVAGHSLYTDGVWEEIIVPSMDYAFKWWHRVKTWRMTHTLLDDGIPSIIPSGIDFDAHGDSAADEGDLICPTTEGCYKREEVFNMDGSLYQWNFALFRNFFDPVPIDGAVTKNAKGEVAVRVELYLFEDTPGTLSAGLTTIDFQESRVSDATLTVDGVTRSLREFPPEVGETVYPGWTGNIAFTPIAFYPHAQEDGENPKYDAVTGKRL